MTPEKREKARKMRVAQAFVRLWQSVKAVKISTEDNIKYKVGLIPPNVIFLPKVYIKVFKTFWKEHALVGKVFKLKLEGKLYKFCNLDNLARCISFTERHKYSKEYITLKWAGTLVSLYNKKKENLHRPIILDRSKQHYLCSYVKGYTYPYVQITGSQEESQQDHLIAGRKRGGWQGYNIIFIDEENLFKPSLRKDDKIKDLLNRSKLVMNLGSTTMYAVN